MLLRDGKAVRDTGHGRKSLVDDHLELGRPRGLAERLAQVARRRLDRAGNPLQLAEERQRLRASSALRRAVRQLVGQRECALGGTTREEIARSLHAATAPVT